MPRALSRGAARRLRREANDIFKSLCTLELDSNELPAHLVKLMDYEDVLRPLVSEWSTSVDKRLTLRAKLVQALLDAPVEKRRQLASEVRCNYLSRLREEITQKLAGVVITVEVPIDQRGPVFSSLSSLLTAQLTSKSFQSEHGLTEAMNRVQKVVWPSNLTLSTNLRVKLQMDCKLEAIIRVRLVPETKDLPPELQHAFQQALTPPTGQLQLQSLRDWEPEGATEEQMAQVAEQLYGLYTQGFGETEIFQHLVSRFMELVERRRLEELAKSIERTNVILYATVSPSREMNPITTTHFINTMINERAISRRDIVALETPVPQRVGEHTLQLRLKMDVTANPRVSVKAPKLNLPEFIMNELQSQTQLPPETNASDQELLESLEDSHLLTLNNPTELASHTEDLGRSCRALFQLGFWYRLEFNRRLTRYCLAKSHYLSQISGSASQISSRQYYLVFLSENRKLPREFRYEVTFQQVFQHILPSYLYDVPRWTKNPTVEWDLDEISAGAFDQFGSLAKTVREVYAESPHALGKALVDVASSDLALSMPFITSLKTELRYEPVRAFLTYAVMIAALDDTQKTEAVKHLLPSLIGCDQIVVPLIPQLQNLLKDLQEYLLMFLERRSYYNMSTKYAEVITRLRNLEKEVEKVHLTEESQIGFSVLPRTLTHLVGWVEERFREDSLRDPNLSSRSSFDADGGTPLVHMTPEGYMRARQLLVEYEKGLASALELKAGGGIDSGDTYHDSFTFEEGERQERMYRKLILDMKERLALAKIIDNVGDQPPDRVKLGTTVRLRFEDMEEVEEYTLLGEVEADPSAGIISHKSPLGLAIVGAQVGEIVEYTVGSNILRVEIAGIRW